MKKVSIVIITCVFLMQGCGASKNETIQTQVESKDKITPQLSPPQAKANYIGFESAPVRPIAMSENKQFIYVTNTSNNSLDVFKLNDNGKMVLIQSVTVGLEPVAVAVSGHMAWVVNHLSDSISVVDVSKRPYKVIRTLLVGDEPRDIVFAKNKAFITTAHRGQQRLNPQLKDVKGAGDAQLHNASIGRADIWVFDRNNLGQELGGKPLEIVSLFGDTMRSLAVSNDQSTVYGAVLHSGNQTTAVHEAVMCYGFEDDEYGAYPCQVLDNKSSPNGLPNGYLPGGRTAPGTNAYGEAQPWTSMIVKYDSASGQWRDSKGRNFSNGVRFTLPDNDVFAIDVDTHDRVASYRGVGTTLFNLAVNPINDELYVTNSNANNAVRFEGAGTYTGSTVQGDIARMHITVIDPFDAKVSPRHLNRHLNYQSLKGNAPLKQHSLSTPMQMAISSDGKTLYSAVMGSNKVAVLPTSQLSSDTFWDNQGAEFDPTQLSQYYIDVEGGPAGVLLDEQNNTLYVYTRFDNSVVSIDLSTYQQWQRVGLFSPEPEYFAKGRSLLYDANRSSSNGESSCASCHIFGDTDHLSWNLGNPDERNGLNPQPFPTQNLSELGCLLVGPEEASCQLLNIINGDGYERSFASMKGPMMTQTMRGMQHHGHMHWRGDRSTGYFGDDTEQTLDERTSFKNFIVAFERLLGLDIHLPSSVASKNKSNQVTTLENDMDHFADFMLGVALPPNPIRSLDNQLSQSATVGADFFHGQRRSDGAATDTSLNGDSADGVNCAGCHGVDPANGFYGSRGEIAHGGEIQILKVPQLRNLYTRVGMFGLPDREGFLPSHTSEHQGAQIRGFGFLHDGATDQLLNFLKGGVFDNGEKGCPTGADERHGCHFNAGKIGIPDESTRQGLVDYMMEFDNDLAPIVGQQISINARSSEHAIKRVMLFAERATTPFVSKLLGGQVTECDLIATGIIDGQQRGYLLVTTDRLVRSDSALEQKQSLQSLLALAQSDDNALTFTCTVPGKGWQAALDRNMNGFLNYDESRGK